MAVNYDINYDDSRFTQVEYDKTAALSDLEKTYADMVNNSDKYFQQQIDASKQWANKQTELQNQKTDFAIQEIEQQKAQAKKDYTKEQSGAYVDWQKQSNQYGATSEEMAAQGLTNTGFSESSQVSMYNTYQNRVATAREAYTLAVQNYNNSITQARLQNNSILAEIAYEALQQQLELSLQGFQYKNELIREKTDKKINLENEYYSRYQDVLKQINTENALAEEVRQYNESLAMEKQKLAEEQRQFNEQMAFEKEQYEYQKQQAAAQAAAKKRVYYSSTPSSNNNDNDKDDNNKGQLTQEPVNRYQPSQSVLKKINSLKTMQGMMGSATAVPNSVIAYQKLGQITMDDAEYMLKQLGYNPKKYMD